MNTERIRQNGRSVENLLAFFSIFLLALFPFLEVIARRFFHTGIRDSTEITHQLVLVLAFIGAAITARENRHLSLALNLKFRPEILARIQVANALISTTFCTAFAWCSLSFLLNAFDPAEKLVFIPVRWIAIVMPLGYALMAYRFIRLSSGQGCEQGYRGDGPGVRHLDGLGSGRQCRPGPLAGAGKLFQFVAAPV